jgi:hypothetical protein
MLGFQAGLSNTIGSGNNFFGKWAGKLNTDGSFNAFFGTQAGQSNTTGSSNTYVGYKADGSAALTNATAIGANATATQSNSVVLGNNANVGIGTSAPAQKLHVVGDARVTGAILDSNNDPGTAGQVLSSTVTGTDWVALVTTTLQAAYDGDRSINATTGAVRINGTDGLLVSGTYGSGATSEVSGSGTRMFFNPRKAAFRAGFTDSNEWDVDSIGGYSIAMGHSPKATGLRSVAFGWNADARGANATALGTYSTATGFNAVSIGQNSKAIGQGAVALGRGAEATGGDAVAIGYLSKARSYGEIAIGQRNTDYTPNDAFGFHVDDRLFVIGNGNLSDSDALVMLKNGNTGIGTSTPAQKLHVEGDARISNLNGTGYRTVFADELGNLVTVLPEPPLGEGSNATAMAIPDNSCGVQSTLTLSGLPTAVASSSITVKVYITHQSSSDLTIYLTAPDGSVLNLYRNQSVGNASVGIAMNLVFNDNGIPIPYSSVLQNAYKPFGYTTPDICGLTGTVASFGALGGGTINPNGVWRLRVTDVPAGDTGTLHSWEITLDPGVASSGGWSTTGNGGTAPSNFIGTTDSHDLRFKVNNKRAGILATNGNVALGIDALPKTTFGKELVAIGDSALANNSVGDYNTAIGSNVLYSNTTGDNNTAIGRKALYSNTTGYSNTASGTEALYSNTTGYYNTASGTEALYSNTTGFNNTANGNEALFSNTSGYSNTASGNEALYSNTTGDNNTANGSAALGANTTGSNNTAVGWVALRWNTTGFNNTANGYASLRQNTTGYNNTASGFEALNYNITGTNNTANGASALSLNTSGNYNTANGGSSLYSNTTGGYNTATGVEALFSSTSGSYNTANGMAALYLNTTGYSNSGYGHQAMRGNTTGYENTGMGFNALYSNTTGFRNTALGHNANSIVTTQSNTMGLGYDADPTAANTVKVGNSSVSSIKGQVGFTAISDQRFKKNIKEDEVKGLEFITKLRPVTYNFDIKAQARWKEANYGEVDTVNWEGKYDIEKIRFSGFLAQEVEATAKAIGYEFSGVDAPKNDKDVYGLRYAEFVVPLVKAVQEQQQQLEQLKPENTVSKEEFDAKLAEKDAEMAEKKQGNS